MYPDSIPLIRDPLHRCRFGDITIPNSRPSCFRQEPAETSCQKIRRARSSQRPLCGCTVSVLPGHRFSDHVVALSILGPNLSVKREEDNSCSAVPKLALNRIEAAAIGVGPATLDRLALHGLLRP
jgi:hypothetical protein